MIRTIFLVGLVSTGLLFATNAMADEASDAAGKLFDEASSAADKKDFATCIAKSEAAWAKFQHAQIRGLEGRCEVELGKYRDGATHIAFYERSSSSAVEPGFLDALKRAKEHLEELTVTSTSPNAEVIIDDAPVGKVPATVFLDAGKHTIAIRVDGAIVASEPHDSVAGTKLKRDLGGGGSEPSTRRPIWPAVLLGSVAAVGLGTGIALGVVGSLKHGDAVGQKGLPCPGGSAMTPSCSNLDSLIRQSNTLRNAGWGVGAVGLAAAAGAVLYVVIPQTKASSTTARIDVRPGGASFSFSGAFE